MSSGDTTNANVSVWSMEYEFFDSGKKIKAIFCCFLNLVGVFLDF